MTRTIEINDWEALTLDVALTNLREDWLNRTTVDGLPMDAEETKRHNRLLDQLFDLQMRIANAQRKAA